MTAAFTTNLDRFSEIHSLAREDTKKIVIPCPVSQVFVAHEMTVMMAVAYVAGEPLSNRPRCTAPFLSIFAEQWGHALRRHEREDLLLPFVPYLVDARGGGERYLPSMALDWLVRESLPLWLRAVRYSSSPRLNAAVRSGFDEEGEHPLWGELIVLLNDLRDKRRIEEAKIARLLEIDRFTPAILNYQPQELPQSAEFAAYRAITAVIDRKLLKCSISSEAEQIAPACEALLFFSAASISIESSIRASTRGPKRLSRDEIVERARSAGNEAVRTVGLRAQGSALALLRRMIDRV